MSNLAKFFKDDLPTIEEDKVDDATAFTTVEAWKHYDFLCQSCIPNGLSDALYKELQLIIHGILAEGMVISESFQIATIIEKLPPSWNDFKNYLKHKRMEMSREDLIVAKKVRANEANAVEEISKEMSNMDLCVVIFEVNTVDSNPIEWWFDTAATCHKCYEKYSFFELVPCDKREKLYMNNVAASKINGKGTVVLKMTSRKEIKLQNVFYVPNIRKNLVSGALLCVHGFRMVFESQKLILSKGGMFVGRGYVLNDMRKLNAIYIKAKTMNKNVVSSSAYMFQSFNYCMIKMVRSDRGGEYVEPCGEYVESCGEYVEPFGEYCAQHSIIHEVTPPYSS
ncbi:uncharacterized protein LOC105771746 [Gossypium raimondii]|uniref:uncharacterized protein LOC105771746 n=1 Tax=Gossypium raimondii TaxID=29730 RepID=UPI00063A8C66|nr:uncharacterized protein LOC105771746 [Gossypium raimondii]